MNKQQLVEQIQQKQSYLCVGLDTDISKLPPCILSQPNPVVAFNKAIIEATKDVCVSYKINTAFYESLGKAGWEAMEETLSYIPDTHFTIADAKRGDIGNTSSHYAKAFFETLSFDAITVAPYMGEDSIKPFLEYEDKVTIVLGLTSNKGSFNFQQLMVEEGLETGLIPSIVQGKTGSRLYEKVIQTVSEWGNENNLMFVVGATRASDLEHIRSYIPNHFLLVPGVGFQGGSLAEVSKFGLNKEAGLLVNVSRAIIFASNQENFAEEAAHIAQQYQFEMAKYLSDSAI